MQKKEAMQTEAQKEAVKEGFNLFNVKQIMRNLTNILMNILTSVNNFIQTQWPPETLQGIIQMYFSNHTSKTLQ